MTTRAQTLAIDSAARQEHDAPARPRKFGAWPAYNPLAALRRLLPRPGNAQKSGSSPREPLPILAERPAGLIFFPLIALGLWVLTHAYQGIVGDASVYIGRALADLDPSGVGRDMVFVHDGQSRFSIIPLLTDHLVAAFGTQATGLLLAYSAMAAWIVALAAFAGRYVSKPFIAIVVIFVAALPTSYGAPLRFHFAQALAVPRPLSEALVLAALAGLAAGRTWLGFAFLFVASLVHPLMALAGWGVFALILSTEDRRWIAVFAAAALLGLAGALAGVPVLDRLFEIMNPVLKSYAEGRSPHLFPTLWPMSAIGPILAEAATLAIAASFVTGRRRMILLAAIIVGIGGIALQALFGDGLSLLLVIQVQLWRMSWLMAALGGAALAFCAIKLWRDGPLSHVVLALLAVAWLCSEVPVSAGLLAASALAVHFGARRYKFAIGWTAAYVLWALASVLALFLNVHYFVGYADFMARMPAAAPHMSRFFWIERYIAFPIFGIVLLLAFSRRSRIAELVLGLAAIGLCLAAARFWDDRAPFQKLLDKGAHPPALVQAIASRPGEVLWVDGMSEAWYLLGRPQWGSPQQGISAIFSPKLAREWHRRMQFLVKEGLAEKTVLKDYTIPSWAELPRLTKKNVGALCSRPDAPAWIIAPVYKNTIIPPGLAAHEWRPARPDFKMTQEKSHYAWHRIDAYAILPCARRAARPL